MALAKRSALERNQRRPKMLRTSNTESPLSPEVTYMGFDPALQIFGGMALGVLLEGEGGMCSDEDMVVRKYRGAYTSVDSSSSGTGRKKLSL